MNPLSIKEVYFFLDYCLYRKLKRNLVRVLQYLSASDTTECNNNLQKILILQPIKLGCSRLGSWKGQGFVSSPPRPNGPQGLFSLLFNG